MRTFLVTGGAGFIGSHLVEALVRRGDHVRIFDNLSTGRLETLASLRGQVEIIQGDLTETTALAKAVQGVECIFHEAALASVHLSVENPFATHAAAASGTLNLLDLARRAGVRRVVYAGSSSAYGNQPHAANREDDPPAPLSPYAAAKLAAEYYCHAFYHTYGLETVTLRYFNVFGPRQDPNSPYSAVIPRFITRMLAGQPPVIYGDGRQSRDFTFVGDVVQGNLLAADAPQAVGRSINMAGGKSISLLQVIATLNEMLGTKLAPQHEPARPGDVRDSMADITLARSLLKYEPAVEFSEGIRRSIEYYRSIA